jgi:hypothetical protein
MSCWPHWLDWTVTHVEECACSRKTVKGDDSAGLEENFTKSDSFYVPSKVSVKKSLKNQYLSHILNPNITK